MRLWEHEPDDNECLDGVVEWEPVENDVDKGLDEGEEAEDHPVRQPLHIILWLWGLQSPQGEVCWSSKANEVGQESCKDVEEDELRVGGGGK